MTNAGFWGALDSVGFQATRVLMTLLWQSSLVLLAAGGLAWLLRRRQAAVRHLVWVTALVAAPVLPLAAWLGGTVGVPQAKIPVMPAYTVEPAAMPMMQAAEQEPAAAPMPRGEMPSLAPPPAPRGSRFTLSDYPWALALLAYGVGALLFLVLVLLCRYRISRWMAGGSVVTDERVLGAFGEAGRQLGLSRRPLIVATAQIQAPVTIGALRAAVLLPEEFEAGLPDADLRAIALHECAHIRRRDPLVLSLASLLRAVLFFHPLVWLACRQISLLTEQAADDAVLDVTGEPVAYAKMLARVAEQLRRRSLTTELAAGIVLSKSAFLRRVEAILSDRRDSLRRLSRRALALTILAALLSLFLASALPLSEKESAATKQESGARAEKPTPPTGHESKVRAPLTAAELALRDKLAKHVTFSFTETPLEAVVDFLHQATDINVVVDQRVLDAAGPGGKRVTLTCTDVPVEDALGLIVKAVQLDWMTYRGVVLISEESRLRDLEKREQSRPKVEPGNEATQAKLKREVTFSFTDTPLEATADFFHMASGVNIILNRRVLADAGPGGKRVTLTLANVPLQDALDIMLTMLDLEWTVRDGSVQISPSIKKPEPTAAPADALRETKAISPGVTSGAKMASGSGAGGKEATQGGGALRYRHGLLPVLQQEVGYLGGQELKRAEQKPELKAEPAYAGEPVYFLIELGEKGSPPHVVAYDPKGGGGVGAVYFDLDQDGDLAEEEPLVPAGWGGTDNFGPIAVKLTRDGFAGICHFWLERRPGFPSAVPSSSPSPSSVVRSVPDAWMLRPGCYNVGEITFEGRTYEAAMVDAFTNGRFNDICWSRLGQGDVLLVDWNGDGKFDVYEQNEYVMVGERYWRDGNWYRPSVSTDGTEVSFTPANFELAPLLTGQEKFWMQITSLSNTGSVQIEGTGGRVDLPVDSYSLYLCGVEAKDAEGNTWRAEAVTGGPYPKFEVKAGEENRYAFGPPLSVSLKASPEGSYQPGQTIRLQATIAGAEGKTYVVSRNGGSLTGPRIFLAPNGEPMIVPKVVLKDESGKEIGSFKMQGGYPGGSGSWTVPDNVKGKVTASVSIDASPFAWNAEDLVLEVK